MAKDTGKTQELDHIVALAIRGDFTLDAFLEGDLAGIEKDVLDIFDEGVDEMEGITPRLPQIGIVHQAQLFKMPDGEKIPSFEAWCVDSNASQAWWEKSFQETGGGVPPECFSLDGILPDPSSSKLQSKMCSICPKNQYGSAIKDDGSPGRGCACKAMRRVHVVLPGSVVPHRLTLSPANLAPWGDFLTREVEGKRLRLLAILVRFELKPEVNQDGIEYSEIVSSVVKDPNSGKPVVLARTHETAKPLTEFRAKWMGVMRGQTILSGEMQSQDIEYDAPEFTGGADSEESDGYINAADLMED